MTVFREWKHLYTWGTMSWKIFSAKWSVLNIANTSWFFHIQKKKKKKLLGTFKKCKSGRLNETWRDQSFLTCSYPDSLVGKVDGVISFTPEVWVQALRSLPSSHAPDSVLFLPCLSSRFLSAAYQSVCWNCIFALSASLSHCHSVSLLKM